MTSKRELENLLDEADQAAGRNHEKYTRYYSLYTQRDQQTYDLENENGKLKIRIAELETKLSAAKVADKQNYETYHELFGRTVNYTIVLQEDMRILGTYDPEQVDLYVDDRLTELEEQNELEELRDREARLHPEAFYSDFEGVVDSSLSGLLDFDPTGEDK